MIQLNTIPDVRAEGREKLGNGMAGARFVEDLAGIGCGSCHGVNLLSGGREPSEKAELPVR